MEAKEKRMRLIVYGKDYFKNEKYKPILVGNIKRISHFSVVRDYNIELDNGQIIEIDADAIEMIANDWFKNNEGK